MYIQDINYYPKNFIGHTMVSSVVSGNDTLETHEFYNRQEKVVFYWKVKKDSDGNVKDFRLKIPAEPAAPSESYVSYDDLA
ncbi:MAG: hypothetical protein KAR19_03770 [Bacteroidales bacterium]|nr:hypothetical protein [Bacteroidales bacterium]